MNDHDLEQKLRSLKPTAVAYRPPEDPQVTLRDTCGSLKPDTCNSLKPRWYWLALPLAVAASLLVIVSLFAPEAAKKGIDVPPEIVIANVEPSPPHAYTPKFPTVRQLSREVLAELQLVGKTADGRQQTAGKKEYPVIELTVAEVKYVPDPPRLEGIFHSRSEVNFDL